VDYIFNLSKMGGAQHKEQDINKWLGKWKGPETWPTLSKEYELDWVILIVKFIPDVGFWVIDMAPLDGLWSPLPDIP
jgi:hypothetical protein